MHLIKPAWLEHRDENRRFEICTLDVSPDGKRLATGGLDAKIRIWSTEAIRSSGNEDATPGARQLCSMATHNGAVTVARFSPNGRYLASGSDDRIALIWELDTMRQPRQEFGSKGEKDTEVWTARKRLIGHDSDIQDLAWSPDGALLVTVGLDSAIIVWSGTTFEKLKRIDSHQSLVKGVTFDPANKYFVTCGDDRSARIIRYARTSPTEMTFSVEAVIELPFQNSPLSTYFRRCSWAPNGEFIACANATNGPVPTVAIINRGEWDSEISLVGHDGPCEVAKFSPRLYMPRQKEIGTFDPQKDALTVLATGGHDRALAIWNTSNPRPLLVAHNICDKAVSDIAWSPDGVDVYVASLDGTVLLAVFDKADFGTPLDVDTVQAQLKRYGGTTNDMDIPESVEQLAVEEKFNLLDESRTVSEPPVQEPVKIPAPATNQIETTAAQPSEQQVADSGGARGGDSTEHGQTEPVDSQNAEIASVSQPTAAAPTVAEAKAPSPARPAVNTLAPRKQKVTITKDGKKRVAPMLVTAVDTDERISAAPSVTPLVTAASVTSNTVPEFSRPSHALPQGGVASLVVGNKRKGEDSDFPVTKKTKDQTAFIRPALINPATVVSQVRLSTPKVFTHLSTEKNARAVLEIRNGDSPTDPARIAVVRNGRTVFVDYVAGYAHLLTGSVDTFWAVATEDGAVYTFSPQGSRLIPPFVLGSSLAILEAQGPNLIAVTSVGMVHTWNIEEHKALFPGISLAPVLDSASKYAENGLLKAPTITQCILHEDSVLITLSNGMCYTYDPALLCWHRVSEPFWAYGSQYWDSTGFASLFEDNPTGGPITIAERRTNEEALLKAGARGKQLQRLAKNRMLQDGYQGFEDVVSVAHLENRIAAAAMMCSLEELRKFLEMYVRRLAQDGKKEKLVELFRFLMGDNTSRGAAWQSLDRREILADLLKVASKYRAVQSVVVEYDAALTGML